MQAIGITTPLSHQLAHITFYFCGVFGSVAAELVSCLNATVKDQGRAPAIYKSPFYLTIRALVALGPAGGLPLLLHANNALTAFYLGLSAPLILDRMQRSVSENRDVQA